MVKTIQYILAIVALLTAFFGAYKYIDTNYAKAQEVQQVSQRLDFWITYDQYLALDKRIYNIKQEYKDTEMPDSIKEEYRNLKEEKDFLKRKLDNFNKFK